MIRTRAVEQREGGGRWLSLLVSGLSDAELARIVRELDADEVMEIALGELATRAEPLAGEFAHGSVTFAVTDRDAVAWSLAGTETNGIRVERGAVAPNAVEIRASFAVTLQLLAGTLSVDDAQARGLVVASGDAGLLLRLAPYLPETATPTPGAREDPASAS